MVSTKAEAEALSMEELTTELTSRGLPTEGLKVSPPLFCLRDFFGAGFLGSFGRGGRRDRSFSRFKTKPKHTPTHQPAALASSHSLPSKASEAVVRAVGSVVGVVCEQIQGRDLFTSPLLPPRFGIRNLAVCVYVCVLMLAPTAKIL